MTLPVVVWNSLQNSETTSKRRTRAVGRARLAFYQTGRVYSSLHTHFVTRGIAHIAIGDTFC